MLAGAEGLPCTLGEEMLAGAEGTQAIKTLTATRA